MANNLAINGAFNPLTGGPITTPMQPPPGFTFGPNGKLIPIAAPQPTNAPQMTVGQPSLTNIPGLIPPPDVNQLTGGQPLVTVPPTGPVTIDETTGQPIQPPLPQAPPTGLIGAEQALQTGAAGGIESILTGFDVSRQDIEQGRTGAISALDRAKASVSRGTEEGRQDILAGAATSGGIIQAGVRQGVAGLETGARKAVDAITSAGGSAQNMLDRGIEALEEGKTQGLNFLNETFQQAVDPITGFVDPGQRAQILQAALTGALGEDAQRAAITNFINDPSLAAQVEEAERALIRNASATGGLGGGRVRKALVRQAVDRSQRSFNDRINQLGQQAALGLSAATAVGGLRAQQGVTGAGLISRTAEGVAGLRQVGAGITERGGIARADIFRGTARDISGVIGTGALAQADVEQRASTAIANLAQAGGFAEADVDAKAADIERATGVDLATVAEATGVNISNILTNLGSQSADVRTQAGRDIAKAIATTSAQLADLQQAEGVGVANIVGTQIGNIANLLLDQGLLDAGSQEQLAILLGNIAIGEGTTAANIAQNVGNIEAAGILGRSADVQDAVKALTDLLGRKAGREEK